MAIEAKQSYSDRITYGDLLKEATGTQEYIREHNRSLMNGLGGVAIENVFTELADKERRGNKGYDTDRSRLLDMSAAIPEWLGSQIELDGVKGEIDRLETQSNGRLGFEERSRKNQLHDRKDELLETIIDFNHKIREIVDMEQFTSISDFTKFVGESLLARGESFGAIGYASREIARAVNGMRHEIAAEGVLNSLKGVTSVRRATRAEERKGVDIVVIYRGVGLTIDIKASEAGVQESKYATAGNSLVVWSGFTGEDFTGGLVLPNERIKEKEGYYRRMLEDGISRNKIVSR